MEFNRIRYMDTTHLALFHLPNDKSSTILWTTDIMLHKTGF